MLNSNIYIYLAQIGAFKDKIIYSNIGFVHYLYFIVTLLHTLEINLILGNIKNNKILTKVFIDIVYLSVLERGSNLNYNIIS